MIRQFNSIITAISFLTLAMLGRRSAQAQIARISEFNTIAWFQVGVDASIKGNWGFHIDGNARRVDFVRSNMQGMIRLGVNYKVSAKLSFRGGLVLAHNSPYGEYPVNAFGKSFEERRMFEMVNINDNIQQLELQHRFMLEQRWLDKFSKPDLEQPDGYTYLNRFRYMLRLQLPLKSNAKQETYPYLAAYDELMIGFGNQVNANIFDQNRAGFLVGYRWSSAIRLEAGYLNQLFQLPRRVNNNNVIQHNNGLQVNLLLNLTTSKRK